MVVFLSYETEKFAFLFVLWVCFGEYEVKKVPCGAKIENLLYLCIP